MEQKENQQEVQEVKKVEDKVKKVEDTQFDQKEEDVNENHKVGRRIAIKEQCGTIQFVGKLKHTIKKESKVQNYQDLYLGISWDDPKRGKHQGTVKDYTYFTSKTSASLIKPKKANFGRDLYSGILRKYFKDQYESLEEFQNSNKEFKVNQKEKILTEFDDNAYFETVKKIKKKVEFVGFNMIWNQINDLNLIKEMSLPDLFISSLGFENSISKLLPNLQTLSIERNLLYDWNQIYFIGNELPNLENFAISRNRLLKPKNVNELDKIYVNASKTYINVSPKGVFKKLKNLCCVGMDLDWDQVSNFLPAFPVLEELILKDNNCKDFENIRFKADDLPTLTILNIERNHLTDFKGILEHFSDYPNLNKLNINHNEIGLLGKIWGFKNLTSFSIDYNPIESLDCIQQLAHFPSLEEIRIKNCPIGKVLGASYVRQRVIAEIKTLMWINGSNIKKFERKDCEIYYLRKTFQQFFEDTDVQHFDYDMDDFNKYCEGKHQRIPELIKMYGNPYEISEEVDEQIKRQKQLGENQMVKLQLNPTSGPYIGKQVSKKFPVSISVLKFKNLLSFIFAIDADRMIVRYQSHPKELFQELDDDQKDLQFYSFKNNGIVWVDLDSFDSKKQGGK